MRREEKGNHAYKVTRCCLTKYDDSVDANKYDMSAGLHDVTALNELTRNINLNCKQHSDCS